MPLVTAPPVTEKSAEAIEAEKQIATKSINRQDINRDPGAKCFNSE
jgi:hypothetical protein